MTNGALDSSNGPIYTGDIRRDEARNKSVMPIATVGMACRLPGGVTTAEELYELCLQGRAGWSETPGDRFNLDGFYHPIAEKRGSVNDFSLSNAGLKVSSGMSKDPTCCKEISPPLTPPFSISPPAKLRSA